MLAKLGVNIDHVATLRQLRGTPYPSLLEAATFCKKAGASQITVHLREDRRHIQDLDVKQLKDHLKKKLKMQLNLEMAVTDSMVRFASQLKPDWVCLVPEKRQELTTEGGLNLKGNFVGIKTAVQTLKKRGIKVSLFIEPSLLAVKDSAALGADAIELHTGKFCLETQKIKPSKKAIEKEWERIQSAVLLGHELGLHVHAGHGIDYGNIRDLIELPIEEYNIGHSIVCRAVEVGMERAVREMVSAIVAP